MGTEIGMSWELSYVEVGTNIGMSWELEWVEVGRKIVNELGVCRG